MFSSSQPAQVRLSDPAMAKEAMTNAASDADSSTAGSASSDETAPAEKRADPTEHPLVKGVMAQFAAKIVEVRRKE